MRLNTMRQIAVLAAALALAPCTAPLAHAEADDPIMGKPFSKLTEAEKEARRQKILEFQGGMIEVAPSGPKFHIIDRRAEKDGIPAKVSADFLRNFKIGVEVGEAADPAEVLATVEVVDEAAGLPALTVFPEEMRAVVNCAALGERNRTVRLERELWRAICFVGGAGYSASTNSLAQPIRSQEELDAIDSRGVNMATIGQLAPLFNKFGVKKGTRVSYRNAVRQGWAPAPTNDLQRAVWEDEKARMAARAANGGDGAAATNAATAQRP